MDRTSDNTCRFGCDQTGQTTVEWALLLACFALPMAYVFGLLLSILAEYYRMVTFLETLPMP
ncbi:MAG: hypothetical protein SVT52_02280 [Planctomycetota bacterium]|nr:hypothetical protein [Planctomycetota bacterium]